MSVFMVSEWRINPGRHQDFRNQLVRGKELVERNGGKLRAYQTVAGGPNSGIVRIAIEFDDLSALQRFQEKSQADQEWLQHLTAEILSANASATQVSGSLLTEMSL